MMFWIGLAAAVLALASWQDGEPFRAGVAAGIAGALICQEVYDAVLKLAAARKGKG